MIVFKRITFKNFLSSGNTPVTINLNDHKTTLIHGINGTGKSTVLDAICFALFNKPFRSINIPQLVNSANKKGLLTEVEFDIGKNNYVVARGMKPKVFDILVNGEPLKFQASNRDNQNYLEQNILKMNVKSFIQCVILGSSSYIPFMQLASSARRDCIEDFLDIKVFSVMSLIAKERYKSLKDITKDLKNDLSNLDFKIEIQEERVNDVILHSKSSAEEIEKKIEELRKIISLNQNEIGDLTAHYENLSSEINTLMNKSPIKKQKEYNEVVIKMRSRLESLKKEIDFYTEHKECPTCSQTITSELKDQITKKNVEESGKYQDAVVKAQGMLDDFTQLIEEVQTLESEAQSIHYQIGNKQTEIDTYNKTIKEYEDKLLQLVTDTGAIEREKGKLEVMVDNRKQLNQKYETSFQDMHEHGHVVELLKDSGIKTQVVRKYLPVMNKLIRKYLTDLDFPIHFTLDEEFSETVSSPMYQDFSYGSFSEGQKSRIDLSLLLTWREIGKLKNSVSVNLLILDEVFSSSLDQTGKELLFALLKFGMDDTQKILVVDHTLDSAFKDKFDRCIEVSKVGGFSRYSGVSPSQS